MLERLPQQWLKRGPVSLLLLPLSWIYRALHQTRLWLYRHGYLSIEKLPVPVIVVGNVVVGGAGKTPLVMALVHHLHDRIQEAVETQQAAEFEKLGPGADQSFRRLSC